MPFSVLPLRAVAFQILFLLMAIAIEAYVLRRELKLMPKQAVQYSATLNLLSTVVGWTAFFGIESILPAVVRVQLMDFMFFDHWSAEIAFPLILAAFATFFGSFSLKLLGLNWLQLALMSPNEWQTYREAQISRPKFGQRPKRDRTPTSNQASAVLSANAFSYTSILVIIFARLILSRLA